MNAKPDLDFGEFAVYPIEAAHSFYGYPRNAEVPPTKKNAENVEGAEVPPTKDLKNV